MLAAIGMCPMLGRTSGKQILLNDVLMRLAVWAVLAALQSNISVAVALPALHRDDSTCWRMLAVCVLACTTQWSLVTSDASLDVKHVAQQKLAHQQ